MSRTHAHTHGYTHKYPTGKSALSIADTKIDWHILFDTVKISSLKAFSLQEVLLDFAAGL